MNTRQRGVAIVEFALMLPFLLLLTFITTEYGRALWEYDTLTKSVRDATRYLSTQPPGTHITQARNLAVYGNLTGTGSPLAMGLSTANVPDPTWQQVVAAPVNGSSATINTVTVRIRGYTFRSMMGSVLGHAFGTTTFSDISATMRSFL